jgi:glycerol-1-phosphate dehydrogenase [NAD(P)+]
MPQHTVEAALRDATDTQRVVVGSGVLDQVDEVFKGCFGDATAIVVADGVTFDVAGKAVDAHLRSAGRTVLDPYVFPARPTLYAKYENIDLLRAALSDSEAIAIAVGSGTINDLVKRTSHELGRPYMVVATAASMDGYTAFAAPITVDGFKTSLPCRAPRALLADLDILAKAPSQMTGSGYGDLLGKLTAGADWMIADVLGIEPIDRKVWPFMQAPFRKALSRPAAVHAGDRHALAGLAEGLVMSGLTIQMYSSSRPGSGAEHLFSHLWEMEGLGLHDDPPLSHGIKVGVGSVAIAALYDQLLTLDLATLDVDALVANCPSAQDVEARVRAHHPNPDLVESAVKASLSKYIGGEQLAVRLRSLAEAWPTLRGELVAQLLPAADFQRMLRDAGAPAHPHEIGLSMDDLRATYTRAQMIRSRYTVLDCAVEAGVLDECLDRLFAPEGFWGAQA